MKWTPPQFTLTARVQSTGPSGRRADGRVRPVITYNGQLPGPLLVVCEDDVVRVTLVNKIKDGPVSNSDGSPTFTTLHFHGIRQVGIAGITPNKGRIQLVALYLLTIAHKAPLAPLNRPIKVTWQI